MDRRTFALLSLLGLACSAEPGDSCARASAAIINGRPALGAELLAVGFLKVRGGGRAFCTGTLLAPNRVVTAKHCLLFSAQDYLAEERLDFAIGPYSDRPEAERRVVHAELLGPDQGGVAELGSDLALLTLESPIDGVPYFRVSPRSLGAGDLGAEFATYGYGSLAETAPVVRQRGELRLDSLHGNVFDRMYGGREAFEFAVRSEKLLPETRACVPDSTRAAAIETRYERGALLVGHEAWLVPGPDAAQPCHGDSGAPLVRLEDSVPTIAGVLSWSFRSAAQSCDHGAVFALLDAERLLLP